MKKLLFIICFLFGNFSVFAFVDKIYVYEESNTLCQIRTGNERSKEKRVLETYLNLINNFVREIDSTQNIYIQFDQQDYYCDHSFYTLSYGNFSDFALYGKISFENSLKISEKFDKKGIVIYFSNNFFKLKPILQLIEYGLKNNQTILENQKFAKREIEKIPSNVDSTLIFSLIYKNKVDDNINNINYIHLNNEIIKTIFSTSLTPIQEDYLNIKNSLLVFTLNYVVKNMIYIFKMTPAI